MNINTGYSLAPYAAYRRAASQEAAVVSNLPESASGGRPGANGRTSAVEDVVNAPKAVAPVAAPDYDSVRIDLRVLYNDTDSFANRQAIHAYQSIEGLVDTELRGQIAHLDLFV